MPLMTLGLFTFELKSAPFETIARSTGQRWATKDRVAAPPAAQYVGPGADQLTIDGTLMPELTGGRASLDKLRDMAAQGKAWALIDGTGKNQGRWYVEEVTERGSFHTLDGNPRKMEFTLTLKRYWDENPEAFGDLPDSLP